MQRGASPHVEWAGIMILSCLETCAPSRVRAAHHGERAVGRGRGATTCATMRTAGEVRRLARTARAGSQEDRTGGEGRIPCTPWTPLRTRRGQSTLGPALRHSVLQPICAAP